jgi:hypothetical protein
MSVFQVAAGLESEPAAGRRADACTRLCQRGKECGSDQEPHSRRPARGKRSAIGTVFLGALPGRAKRRGMGQKSGGLGLGRAP